MIILTNINQYIPDNKSVLTIGMFDGLHLGHRKVISQISERASKLNCNSIALTFSPHPQHIIKKNPTLKLIDTLEEKVEKFRTLGIDTLIIHPFTKEFANLKADDFIVNLLVKKLNVQEIIIGYDHKFGKNREASFSTLVEYGKKYNFDVIEIKAKEINSINISSTKIRNALSQGDIVTVNNYLGTPYQIKGKVINGYGNGKKIGFPTANIQIDENYKLLPKKGVYLVSVAIENKSLFGLLNIGTRPTFSTSVSLSIEVHILEFEGNLYNKIISIKLLKRLRNEMKFDSTKELITQLKKDRLQSLNEIASL